MLSIVSDVLISFGWALAFLTVVFAYGYYRKRYDIIDSAWGPTFVVIAFSMLVQHGIRNSVSIILFLMVLVWAVRLSGHVFSRFLRSNEEDPRYVELRKKWPQTLLPLQVFVRIYVVQAVAATLISLPVIFVFASGYVNLAIASLGIAIWLVGLIIEAAADSQLKIFLSVPENRGKLMTDGLWGYSRHPNYFGEILLWWGIGIIGYSTVYASFSFIGPAVITLLIMFVSGIPPAEKRSSKKPGWKEYAKKTNVLIPWPPAED